MHTQHISARFIILRDHTLVLAAALAMVLWMIRYNLTDVHYTPSYTLLVNIPAILIVLLFFSRLSFLGYRHWKGITSMRRMYVVFAVFAFLYIVCSAIFAFLPSSNSIRFAQLSIEGTVVVAFFVFVTMFLYSINTKRYSQHVEVSLVWNPRTLFFLPGMFMLFLVLTTTHAYITYTQEAIEEKAARAAWIQDRDIMREIIRTPSRVLNNYIYTLYFLNDTLAHTDVSTTSLEAAGTTLHAYGAEHNIPLFAFVDVRDGGVTPYFYRIEDATTTLFRESMYAPYWYSLFLTTKTLNRTEITLSNTLLPTYNSYEDASPIFIMQTPLIIQDVFVGASTVVVPLQEVFDSFASYEDTQQAQLFVVDPEGYYLWHRDSGRMQERVRGQPSSFFRDFPESSATILEGGGITEADEGVQHIVLGYMYPGIELAVNGISYRVNGAAIPLQQKRWIIGLIK